MTNREKYIYHQVHPVKLLVDFAAGFISLYPLWHHQLVAALLVMLMPPPIASFLVMRFADLEPYRNSGFGRYTARYMTHAVEAARLIGMGVMAVGAWYQSVLAVAAGLAIIALAWSRGILIPR